MNPSFFLPYPGPSRSAEREGRKDYISIRDYGFWYGQKKALDEHLPRYP